MRIAIATRTLARVGGAEVYVEQSVRGLIGAGHDVCVFAEDAGGSAEARMCVPTWSSPDRRALSLSEAVRAFGAHVVITHGLDDPTVEEALAGMHPSVFFAHAYHGTCVSGAKAHSFPSVCSCARTLGAGCLVRYYPRRCGGISPVTMIREYRTQHHRLAAVKRHDWLFALSEHIANEYAHHGVSRTRIRILPPPVPPAPTVVGAVPDPNHVVYIGRLERLKGPAIAVSAVGAAAAALRRPLRLTIAGDGTATASVQRALSRLQAGALRDVHLAGPLDAAACATLLGGAGLVVVPSLWPEPFGLVGYEAAAHGVPVAAFRVGGVPEWLIDGVTGHLAEPCPDPITGLRDAIVRALADDEHYASLRNAARRAHAAALERDHMGVLSRTLTEMAKGAVHP
jgi:glycosyltransferase involved in cell wall biosynthesis